ncbi:hypothetical protein N9D23_12960 [Rubripirellula sp.]|jgi:hypothetical protein|nr:hypothetical protein [Rubripirellula sp.]
MKLASIVVLISLLLLSGCDTRMVGSSAPSIDDAKSRGTLIAEYRIPDGADLGPYEPIEVWIENDRKLVVRLDGPHVDSEPRVVVRGLSLQDYRDIWSECDGPPYEVWVAPEPIPDSIFLERDSKSIELKRRL